MPKKKKKNDDYDEESLDELTTNAYEVHAGSKT